MRVLQFKRQRKEENVNLTRIIRKLLNYRSMLIDDIWIACERYCNMYHLEKEVFCGVISQSCNHGLCVKHSSGLYSKE